MQQKRRSFAHTHRQSLFACPAHRPLPFAGVLGGPGFTGFSDRGYVHNSIYFLNIDKLSMAFFSANLVSDFILLQLESITRRVYFCTFLFHRDFQRRKKVISSKTN
ncbi:Uncharacterised protein [Serratia fonticola]|uniref:Uncharacterized protein n=1 Tax=Serratia fonticola TaxID=47917 RepID=A0A0F7H7B8_SERFO|nr:hypothetical protein WN53_03450 [Serratia fonticola]CAI1525549.1 Uncharacterised protein [Serratia fonticola]VTR59293.1 Uncharacterised protein [Serratia fonticola]